MRLAVIDASVAAAWVMRDEGHREATALLESYQSEELRFLAPSLWQYEVASALRKAVASGRASPDEGFTSLELLLGVQIEFTPLDQLAPRCWEIALTRGLSIYDASYVALAEARACEFYTRDIRLAKATRDLVPVQLIRGRAEGS